MNIELKELVEVRRRVTTLTALYTSAFYTDACAWHRLSPSGQPRGGDLHGQPAARPAGRPVGALPRGQRHAGAQRQRAASDRYWPKEAVWAGVRFLYISVRTFYSAKTAQRATLKGSGVLCGYSLEVTHMMFRRHATSFVAFRSRDILLVLQFVQFVPRHKILTFQQCQIQILLFSSNSHLGKMHLSVSFSVMCACVCVCVCVCACARVCSFQSFLLIVFQ